MKTKYNSNYDRIFKMRGLDSVMTAEKYNKEITKLFKKWKASVNTNGTPFITDGVMNPEKWFKQDQRILFVLKEAHDENGTQDWDLANDHVLKNEKFGKRTTWRNISLWTKGMQYYFDNNYGFEDKDLKTFGNKYLHSISAINIKKYNGKKTSDKDDILNYAVNEKGFIKKQIELCDPNVIVCCGTADALSRVVDFDYEHKNSNLFYHTSLNGHDVIVIDYYHPANRFPTIMNYYTLCGIYEKAKQDQKKRIESMD